MLRRHRCFPLQGIFGCGAHSDYGVMTLLATDGTPGLQIK
jgi:isopenicillin N synthase-like dioxygenase